MFLRRSAFFGFWAGQQAELLDKYVPFERGEYQSDTPIYNWKSLTGLRVPGRKGPEKDLVLLRFDVAEPLMHLLKTKGRPAHESIVGWVLVEHKLAYAVLVNLDIDEAPQTPLGLLAKQPE